MHAYLSPATPHLFAHRGASGEAPENTLVAFERAWAQGARFLETDCHATRDGELVLCHDASVDRTTNETGAICDYTYSELSRLDAGHRFTHDGVRFPYRGSGVRIPRLRELLDAFPGARINLEVKQADPPIAEAVVKLVLACGARDRVLLAAEEDAILSEIRALDPGTALGLSRGDAIEFFAASAEGRMNGYRAPGHALQIPTEFMGQPLVTREHLQAAHAAGLYVHVWTINEPAQMRELLALGVDGLMSDHPALLLETARRMSGRGGR